MIFSIFKYICLNFGVSSTYGLDLRACRTKCRISDKVGQNVGFFFHCCYNCAILHRYAKNHVFKCIRSRDIACRTFVRQNQQTPVLSDIWPTQIFYPNTIILYSYVYSPRNFCRSSSVSSVCIATQRNRQILLCRTICRTSSDKFLKN